MEVCDERTIPTSFTQKKVPACDARADRAVSDDGILGTGWW